MATLRFEAWGGRDINSNENGGTMPYDGFGARINAHYPIPTYYPGTLEQPAEITVYCACGQYEYFSQASAGGACDTDYHADYDKHLREAENNG